jgi:hypothetical protein
MAFFDGGGVSKRRQVPQRAQRIAYQELLGGSAVLCAFARSLPLKYTCQELLGGLAVLSGFARKFSPLRAAFASLQSLRLCEKISPE